ncbi:MAG: DUF2934 domain-containing protein [Myxococcales bacterium]
MEKNKRDDARREPLPAPKPAQAPRMPPSEAIAARAYEKFCQRGRLHGYDRQDWFAAEQELAARIGDGMAPAQHLLMAHVQRGNSRVKD